MTKRPRGNKRSRVLDDAEQMALAAKMQLEDLSATDAGIALGLKPRTARRKAAKGLFRTLKAAAEKNIQKIADAATNPNVCAQGKFELPEPSPVPTPQAVRPYHPEAAPAVTPLAEPALQEEPWEFSHLMSHAEFLTRTPHRQKQLIAQWKENEILGGQRWTPVLRGRKSDGPCFGCKGGKFNCSCHDAMRDLG